MTYDSIKRGVAALGLVALAAGAANAQQATAGPKWRGWTGCWTPATASRTSVNDVAPTNGMLVCISPTSNSEVVDVTSIADGKVVSQQKLDASGRELPITAKGCTGVQRGSWSADERRLYLRAASNCDGLRTTTSAILSMTASGEWLDVRGVNAYGDENVRVARYRDAGVPSSVPAEIAAALRDASSNENARIAAGAPIGTTAVIEAAHAADSVVVAAWLLERGQPFTLNAPTLLELSKAGLPGRVTDAMVAVSYPRAFQVARADPRSEGREYSGRRIMAPIDRMYDPYGWGYSTYGYGAYGYNGYGYGYGNPYGGYYGGYYGNGFYSPPIIIVRGSNDATTGRAQAVKGRGYTENRPPSPSGGQQTSSPSPSSTSSSGSSSSGSTSSSSGSSSSESGRTAHQRP